ncbi:hypothetical protein [Polaribacter aestuariivivens]|uniref:hypothetical protein n=1 Tax=Polaribacter aestuariivivens TaxID=2304626 RepID=UPI003F49A09A
MTDLRIKSKIHSKGELFLKYNRLKVRVKRDAINRIICEVRKVKIEVAKKQKTLLPKEVRLFQEEFDLDYY